MRAEPRMNLLRPEHDLGARLTSAAIGTRWYRRTTTNTRDKNGQIADKQTHTAAHINNKSPKTSAKCTDEHDIMYDMRYFANAQCYVA